VRSRQEGIDGRDALRLIQQRHVAALCDLELLKIGILGFHSCERGGTQDVGSLAANRQHGYAAQPLPERPWSRRGCGSRSQHLADHRR